MSATKTLQNAATQTQTELHIVKISSHNSKLGPSILSINLPPVLTCNPNAPCFKDCYAQRGNFRYAQVQNSLFKNLEAYKENPDLYFGVIAQATSGSLFVRWHSSGDIVDERYLEGMVWTARRNKLTTYLAFTKQYGIVNAYKTQGKSIPRNLKIVFSAWKDWIPENPHNFPMAWVTFGDWDKKNINYNVLVPENAFHCPGSCSKCQYCWKMKKGENVTFHKH